MTFGYILLLSFSQDTLLPCLCLYPCGECMGSVKTLTDHNSFSHLFCSFFLSTSPKTRKQKIRFKLHWLNLSTYSTAIQPLKIARAPLEDNSHCFCKCTPLFNNRKRENTAWQLMQLKKGKFLVYMHTCTSTVWSSRLIFFLKHFKAYRYKDSVLHIWKLKCRSFHFLLNTVCLYAKIFSYLTVRGVLGSFDGIEVHWWQRIRGAAWPLVPDVPRDHWAQKVQETGWLRESAHWFSSCLWHALKQPGDCFKQLQLGISQAQ